MKHILVLSILCMLSFLYNNNTYAGDGKQTCDTMRPLCDMATFDYASVTKKESCGYTEFNAKIHTLLDRFTANMSEQQLSTVRALLRIKKDQLTSVVWTKKNESDVYNSFDVNDGITSKRYYVYLYTINYISSKIGGSCYSIQ